MFRSLKKIVFTSPRVSMNSVQSGKRKKLIYAWAASGAVMVEKQAPGGWGHVSLAMRKTPLHIPPPPNRKVCFSLAHSALAQQRQPLLKQAAAG